MTAALLFAAALALAEPAEAPEREEIRQWAESVLADRGFQTELPTDAVEEAGKGHRRGRRSAPSGLELPVAAASSGLSLLAQALLWTVGIGLLVVILLAVGREVYLSLERRRGNPGDAEAAPEEGRRVKLPVEGEAESLAREGRYGEAVHVLLLLAMARLGRFQAIAAERSSTSREVLRRAKLGEEARRALARLVAAVEQSLFGGYPLDRLDWERCLEAYGALESGLGAPRSDVP